MDFPKQFIRATEEFTTFEKPVAAPYFRRSFWVEQAATARLVITALGFYEVYLNGERITKGPLAPYVSNPEDIVYYDTYDLPLTEGENVLGIWLGNGLQNNPGGYIWDFEQASFRSAPCVALELTYACGDKVCRIVSDESFRTAPSPITFDDYRFGEHYDARREIPGWSLPGFDDSRWTPALPAPTPTGEPRLCEAEPIVITEELRPVSITREGDGYRYDFGQNTAGVCRLNIRGTAGQRVELLHGEVLRDGVLDVRNVWFVREHWERDRLWVHRDVYTCKGEEWETYTPTFTYHGFQYVLVTGITEEQATPDLLTYVVMHSALEERGGFSCSDEIVNTLQTLTRRSDLSNFYYFPTDCPHREKNGWSADASLSCEHMLLNLNPENSYREWMRNIYKAQDERGALPGIIPTGGWGFEWGNGPGWDGVLVNLPYYVYVYRGDLSIAQEAAPSILRYLQYLLSRRDQEGLIHFGLGDWCQPDRDCEHYVVPLPFTDTVLAKDLADKAACLFGALGLQEEQAFARDMSAQLRQTVRDRLIDHTTMTAVGNCQTTQAMGLFYNIFNEDERQVAFDRLLDFIREKDEHFDTGVLGGRVIFHVLSTFGHSDLALHMIVRPDFPSYGNWVARGATSLWEDFRREDGPVQSHNHHFWGDISSWFIQTLAGIRLNPRRNNIHEVDIRPSFVERLSHAAGYHEAPDGKIASAWERTGDGVQLSVTIPTQMTGHIILEPGYCFTDGATVRPAVTGVYGIQKQ